jgi:hypothetical protein
MKTPRVQDFDPHAKVPQLGSPMDDLPSIQKPLAKPIAQLRPSNDEVSQKPEIMKARKDESLKGRKEDFMKSGKPESQISGNQAIQKARKPENRKVPKYSTQLEEELQIQVSVFAKMHRLKDYEVVQSAIEEYLKSHK